MENSNNPLKTNLVDVAESLLVSAYENMMEDIDCFFGELSKAFCSEPQIENIS
jgi:hypothetical protein